MSQEIVQIISTFYDEQGEIIPFNSATNTLPMKKLPPDGRVPFELTVTGIQDPNSYNLRVEARPSNESPYQDFDFLNVDQSNQGSEYCISGSLHNPGLSSYLTVVAILYDGEDQVVHFGKGQAPSQRKLANNNLIDFDICVDSLNQKVARHELRAWGL